MRKHSGLETTDLQSEKWILLLSTHKLLMVNWVFPCQFDLSRFVSSNSLDAFVFVLGPIPFTMFIMEHNPPFHAFKNYRFSWMMLSSCIVSLFL